MDRPSDTVDNLGVTRALRAEVANRLADSINLQPERYDYRDAHTRRPNARRGRADNFGTRFRRTPPHTRRIRGVATKLVDVAVAVPRPSPLN